MSGNKSGNDINYKRYLSYCLNTKKEEYGEQCVYQGFGRR